MKFRETRPEDIAEIRARSRKEYDKLPDPQDVEEALTLVDDYGEARLVMKAQRVAELYMLIDHEWASPAMRWALIEKAHDEMRRRLRAKGYTCAYSFFADGVANGYVRRLVRKGWSRVVDRCLRFCQEGA